MLSQATISVISRSCLWFLFLFLWHLRCTHFRRRQIIFERFWPLSTFSINEANDSSCCMEITINCRDSTLNNSSHTKKKSLNFLSPLSRCQGYLQVDLYYMKLHYDHYDALLPRRRPIVVSSHHQVIWLIFLLDFIAIRCQECQKGELKMCRDCDADNGVPKEGAPIICSRRTGSCWLISWNLPGILKSSLL